MQPPAEVKYEKAEDECKTAENSNDDESKELTDTSRNHFLKNISQKAAEEQMLRTSGLTSVMKHSMHIDSAHPLNCVLNNKNSKISFNGSSSATSYNDRFDPIVERDRVLSTHFKDMCNEVTDDDVAVQVFDGLEVISFMDDGFDAKPSIKKQPTVIKKSESYIIPIPDHQLLLE